MQKTGQLAFIGKPFEKKGGGSSGSFKLENDPVYYKLFNHIPQEGWAAQPGDHISFTYDVKEFGGKDYYNASPQSIKKVPASSPATNISTVGAASVDKNLSRDMCIQRQSMMKVSADVILASTEQGADITATAELIIALARKFVDYTSGEADVPKSLTEDKEVTPEDWESAALEYGYKASA
tara:strand:+ start:2608 stop:3150 length:543 start_codon:yes stop_codon:yes gene_type:complete